MFGSAAEELVDALKRRDIDTVIRLYDMDLVSIRTILRIAEELEIKIRIKPINVPLQEEFEFTFR